MTLHYSPDNILTLVKDTWNSPSWAFLRKWKKGELDELLRFLFPKENDPSNGESIFGIANLAWTNIYYISKLPSKVKDCHEYEESLDKGTFENDIEKWTRRRDIAIPFVIWSAFKNHEIDHTRAIRCLLDYIWTMCDINAAPLEYTELSYGYSKENIYHSVRGINGFIDCYHFIDYFFHQFYVPSDENGDDIQAQISHLSANTKHPLELMTLILRLLRNIKDSNDITYKLVASNIQIIWNRIILLENENEDIDTLNILEILYNCTFEDTFEKMSLPLMKDNPRRWLGSTLRICKDDEGQEYMLLSSERIHSLFDSENNAESIIKNLSIILPYSNDNDKRFLEEYMGLFFALADNTIYKKDDSINEDHRQPSSLSKNKYTTLSAQPIIGNVIYMPINDAINKLANSAFWKGNNLRIERTPEILYFAQKI